MIVTIGDEIDGLAVDSAAGGRLCSLRLAGRERLLSAPAAGLDPSIAWGCYLMAPFAGRVKDGIVTWAGRTVRLPPNDGPHAIHGAGFDAEWEVVERAATSLTMTCPIDRARWPFGGSITQRIEISRGHLELDAQIVADEPMPAALGWHPWFLNPDGGLRVGVQSDTVMRHAADLIPTGELVRVDERTDLRSAPRLDGRALDDAYTAVSPPITISWDDLELTIGFDDPVCVVVVCTRSEATAVEPLTAWPDAIRLAAAGFSGTGLVSLAAGERLAATTSWSWKSLVQA